MKPNEETVQQLEILEMILFHNFDAMLEMKFTAQKENDCFVIHFSYKGIKSNLVLRRNELLRDAPIFKEQNGAYSETTLKQMLNL